MQSGARIIPRPKKQTTFYEPDVSKQVKPGAKSSVWSHDGGRLGDPKISGDDRSLKPLEDKKMKRYELLESAAGYAAGITTALAFILLYVALAAPVAETVQKLIS